MEEQQLSQQLHACSVESALAQKQLEATQESIARLRNRRLDLKRRVWSHVFSGVAEFDLSPLLLAWHAAAARLSMERRTVLHSEHHAAAAWNSVQIARRALDGASVVGLCGGLPLLERIFRSWHLLVTLVKPCAARAFQLAEDTARVRAQLEDERLRQEETAERSRFCIAEGRRLAARLRAEEAKVAAAEADIQRRRRTCDEVCGFLDEDLEKRSADLVRQLEHAQARLLRLRGSEALFLEEGGSLNTLAAAQFFLRSPIKTGSQCTAAVANTYSPASTNSPVKATVGRVSSSSAISLWSTAGSFAPAVSSGAAVPSPFQSPPAFHTGQQPAGSAPPHSPLDFNKVPHAPFVWPGGRPQALPYRPACSGSSMRVPASREEPPHLVASPLHWQNDLGRGHGCLHAERMHAFR